MGEPTVRQSGEIETKVSIGYAPVNALQMVYESHGQGRHWMVIQLGGFQGV